MQKNTDISFRVTQIIDYLNVSKNEFSKSLGYSRAQAIYDITKGKAKPSFDFFEKFMNSEYSANIDFKWLITGEGEMLLTKGQDDVKSNNAYNNELRDSNNGFVYTSKKYLRHIEKENDQLKKNVGLNSDIGQKELFEKLFTRMDEIECFFEAVRLKFKLEAEMKDLDKSIQEKEKQSS